jgi:hypothetical protein
MPATHPLARYAALVISRNEPFRTAERRRLPSADVDDDPSVDQRQAPAPIAIPRQRRRSTLASEQ